MVHLKTEEEIQLMRESSLILGKAHGEVAKLVKPGVKTKKLDQVAEEFIRDHDGIPSFKHYGGTFPATLCISHFPVTFGAGVGNHAEIFGSFHVITRIERDTGDLRVV